MLVALVFAVPSAFAGQGPSACAATAAAGSCCAASRAECPAATAAATTAATPATVSPVPGESFLRAERDPETGGWTLAPLWASPFTADQAAALNQSSEGLVSQTLDNGAVSIFLQGRFQNYSVARRTLDGEVETGCIDSPSSLFLWFYGLAPSTPPVARVER